MENIKDNFDTQPDKNLNTTIKRLSYIIKIHQETANLFINKELNNLYVNNINYTKEEMLSINEKICKSVVEINNITSDFLSYNTVQLNLSTNENKQELENDFKRIKYIEEIKKETLKFFQNNKLLYPEKIDFTMQDMFDLQNQTMKYLEEVQNNNNNILQLQFLKDLNILQSTVKKSHQEIIENARKVTQNFGSVVSEINKIEKNKYLQELREYNAEILKSLDDKEVQNNQSYEEILKKNDTKVKPILEQPPEYIKSIIDTIEKNNKRMEEGLDASITKLDKILGKVKKMRESKITEGLPKNNLK